MRLKYIADALTLYFNKKYPDAKGFFVGKESFEPTKINIYKAYKVEIYWHTPGKNYLVFNYQIIDKFPEDSKEVTKEKYSTVLLEQIFTNLNNIENEVIQNGRI